MEQASRARSVVYFPASGKRLKEGGGVPIKIGDGNRPHGNIPLPPEGQLIQTEKEEHAIEKSGSKKRIEAFGIDFIFHLSVTI